MTLEAYAPLELLKEGIGLSTSRGGNLEGLVEHWSGRLRIAYSAPAATVSGLPAYFGYRLVQEALVNVFRHSGQDAAEVTLEVTDGAVRGRVRDEGKGFDPQSPTRRFGLRGMRLRAQLAGRALRVESAPGQGTTVEFTLPV